MKCRFLPAVASCLMLMLPLPAAAQDLSDEELLQLFLDQRDAFRAAREDPLGRTRGLTLMSLETAAPLAEAATTETAVAVAVEADPASPKVFGQLAPDRQINLRIEFAFDSAALEDDQKPKLAQLCTVMKDSDIQLFRIIGHTDATGSDEYNTKLSVKRAEEVRRHFVNDCGIDESRLEAIGVGEKFPFNTDDPEAGENRRVEFQALS